MCARPRPGPAAACTSRTGRAQGPRGRGGRCWTTPRLQPRPPRPQPPGPSLALLGRGRPRPP
eukprot:13104049-Heterocapsa_arctica.AAC.1